MTGNKFAHKLLIWLSVAAAVVAVIPATYGQDRPVGTAKIPFEFFIVNDRMPAGEYTITTTIPSVLHFYSKQQRTSGQVFTLPAGDPVEAKDAKLVFVLFEEKYRLVGLRGIDGVWKVSSVYQTSLPEGATRHEIPIIYVKPPAVP